MHRLGPHAAGLSDAGCARHEVLEEVHRLEEIEAVGVRFELAQQGQSVRHCPTLAGHRMISPRDSVLTTVSANELIDTYCAK